MNQEASSLVAFVFFLLLIAIYFVPTFVAMSREHRNAGAIVVTNLLLGWTFIGWAVALIWACTEQEIKEAHEKKPKF